LQQEFPILSRVTKADAGPITLLEVGAGAGNTAFPILAQNQNPDLKIHACDFSKKAVEVIRENEAYVSNIIQADVWDAAGQDLPPGLEEGSVDIVVMIFIFSALSPSQWKQAVHNIYRVLKPGGEVLFRDYGRGDLAQVRFKKGRYLEENFYIRGDGTRVYFFERDELVDIWTSRNPDGSDVADEVGFEIVDLGVDRRLLVNRAKQLKMYRCWMQGRFRKREKSPT
jgi:tRNAThr (cytosine32-N3)-methyltransferase